jgi:cellulose synthase/poly-beta-1,6-N-acetylglucosamine synthase-like glycosyltransferase
VQRLAEVVVHAHAEVDGYSSGLVLGMRFLVVATLLSLAVTSVASPARRVFIALQAVWYLGLMVCLDAAVIAAAVVFSLPQTTATLVGQGTALVAGMFAMVRALSANYALPRPTSVPFVRRRRSLDVVTLIAVTFSSVALTGCAALLLIRDSSSNIRPLLTLILPLPFAMISADLRTWLLLIMTWFRAPDPRAGVNAPPVDVIIPAFNEEALIVDTLIAIDRAAMRYAGAVRVVVADDGSTDRTNELAWATIGAFRSATGEVIRVRHGGKSATLNSALARCTADIVVRIDADTLVDEWCFYYATRWFRNADIGVVEAMLIPRPGPPPFPRLRLFETLRLYGFNHRAMQVVDGVNAVPGVFTAFRRKPALYLGGFVVGINGEDADFTLNMSRLGYRTWLDPKVVVHEDVPPSYLEFRSQRTRWTRATIHASTRHFPSRAGLATPKVWFSQLHLLLYKLISPIRLTAIVYIVFLAVFHGTWRAPVLLFVAGYLLLNLGTELLVVLLAVRYRTLRNLAWLPLWPLFAVLLHFFSLEGILSLPTRPVTMPGRKAPIIGAPVVH